MDRRWEDELSGETAERNSVQASQSSQMPPFSQKSLPILDVAFLLPLLVFVCRVGVGGEYEQAAKKLTYLWKSVNISINTSKSWKERCWIEGLVSYSCKNTIGTLSFLHSLILSSLILSSLISVPAHGILLSRCNNIFIYSDYLLRHLFMFFPSF